MTRLTHAITVTALVAGPAAFGIDAATTFAKAPVAPRVLSDAIIGTGTSMFPASCSHDHPEIAGSEIEPAVAARPSDGTVLASWMQDYAVGNPTAVSTDGTTWTTNLPFAPQPCFEEGDQRNMINPAVAWDGRGRAYVASLDFDIQQNSGPRSVRVSRSTDGGATWDHSTTLGYVKPTKVGGIVPLGFGPDAPQLAASSTDPDTVYLSWYDGELFDSQSHPFLSVTHDGGLTWSTPRDIGEPLDQTLDVMQMAVAPASWGAESGDLVRVDEWVPEPMTDDLYGGATGAAPPVSPAWDVVPTRVTAARSHDGGQTWTTPVDVIVGHPGFLTLKLAVGPAGQVALAMSKLRDQPSEDIEVVTSSDGGSTWNAPQVVVPKALKPFLSTIAISDDGTIGELFYDEREDVDGDTVKTTDVWLRTSADVGHTWAEAKIASFDRNKAPLGREVGQYQWLTTHNNRFLAAYTVSGDTTGSAHVRLATIAGPKRHRA